MTSITADVYTYNTSYKTLYNVPIVSGATTVMENITVNSFIMVVNEALYYRKQLNHSLINPNQLRWYGKVVWNNHFDTNRDPCLERCECNAIDLIPDITNIGFSLYIPMEGDLSTLPHINVTSGSECNPNTFRIGKVSIDNNNNAFCSQ